jgi:glycine/D-amino acid oxidase-like deaminating enzyme
MNDKDKLPATADVVIVGAGMTGAATAYWWAQLQPSLTCTCVLLDARGLAGGATGRNGGHLWADEDEPFEVNTAAELMQFIETEGIECDLTKFGSAALRERSVEVKQTEASSGSDSSYNKDASVNRWDSQAVATQMHSVAFDKAHHSPSAAQFWPAKVTAALLRVAQEKAAKSGAVAPQLFAPVRVSKIENSESERRENERENERESNADNTPTSKYRQTVHTSRGLIRAQYVVVAANGWTPQLLPELHRHLYPCRNQVKKNMP